MTLNARESQVDLREVLGELRRRWWLFAGLLAILPGTAYIASISTDKEYRASVTLQVQSESVDTSVFSSAQESVGDLGRALAASARRATSLATARSVLRRLPPPRDPRALREKLSVVTDPDAGFLTITARSGSADRAASIANTYGAVLIQIRTQEAEQRIDGAILDIVGSLERLPASDRNGRRQLSEQLQRLRVLRASQGSNMSLIERASPPTKASSPKPVRNVLLAVPLALLLAGGLTFLLERLDQRIWSSDEMVRISPVPLLSSVPAASLPGSRSPSGDVEPFHRLRVGLELLSLDDPFRTVVVTSAESGEGKTTVAVGLARAAAQAGDRVLLIDADLRLSQVGDRLGLDIKHGLEDVLNGGVSLRDALEVVPGTANRLSVLGATAVEHPWRLVASDRMGNLVVAQGRLFDLVVIDTPPVLAVSDALPLCEAVSAVVMVARVNHTRRSSLRRAFEVVAVAQGGVVGIVATGERRPDVDGNYAYRGNRRAQGSRDHR